ncbi:MAG: Mu transposase C-terminal domain-containing protein [Campylobacteraceae bacterium]|jgi:hypothetical protein|nr:Mu transposase C-terminal domain-containing protein [Campylobacteraceae bacterium]
MSWVSCEDALVLLGIGQNLTIRSIQRKAKAAFLKSEKNLQIGTKNFAYRYTDGIGRGGKILQIYSEPVEKMGLDPKNAKKSEIETLDTTYFNLTDKQKQQADERLMIIKDYEHARLRGVSIADFIRICRAKYPEVGLNKDKLLRWQRDYKREGITALADARGKARKNDTKLADWMKEFILNKFRVHGAGKINLRQLWDELHKQASVVLSYNYYGFLLGEEKPLCVYNTVKHFLQNYYNNNKLEYTMITKGEDKAKSYHQPALGNQKEIVMTRNQEWQIDSSPLDMIVLDEDGRQIRPSILSIVDVYSGRCVASLNKTSNSLAIVRLLWKALEKLGKPDYIKGDNGKDYLSKQFQELLKGLNIDYDRAIAYSGDEKATVERHFRTLQHSDISFAHGYIGNCLSAREPIEQRTPKKERKGTDGNGNPIKTNLKHLMTFDEAEKLVQQSVMKWDVMRIRRRKNSLSPIDKWNSCERALQSVDYAQFLLYASEGVVRTVGKKGVTIDSMTYVAIELPHVGTEVTIRHNIDNLQEIYVFDMNGNFVCTAWDKEIAPLSAEDYKLAKKLFKEDTKTIRKMLRSAEASEYTKLNLAIDYEKMQKLHKGALKSETMLDAGANGLKEKIREQKEIEDIKNKKPDFLDNYLEDKEYIKPKKKRITWDVLLDDEHEEQSFGKTKAS